MTVYKGLVRVETLAGKPTYVDVTNEVADIVSWSGIREGVVGCDTEGSNVAIPEEIQTALKDIREKMVAGELVPCKTADELNAWVAENQYTK